MVPWLEVEVHDTYEVAGGDIFEHPQHLVLELAGKEGIGLAVVGDANAGAADDDVAGLKGVGLGEVYTEVRNHSVLQWLAEAVGSR